MASPPAPATPAPSPPAAGSRSSLCSHPAPGKELRLYPSSCRCPYPDGGVNDFSAPARRQPLEFGQDILLPTRTQERKHVLETLLRRSRISPAQHQVADCEMRRHKVRIEIECAFERGNRFTF